MKLVIKRPDTGKPNILSTRIDGDTFFLFIPLRADVHKIHEYVLRKLNGWEFDELVMAVHLPLYSGSTHEFVLSRIRDTD